LTFRRCADGVITFFVIFAVLDVSLAVNLCINCSFFYIYWMELSPKWFNYVRVAAWWRCGRSGTVRPPTSAINEIASLTFNQYTCFSLPVHLLSLIIRWTQRQYAFCRIYHLLYFLLYLFVSGEGVAADRRESLHDGGYVIRTLRTGLLPFWSRCL